MEVERIVAGIRYPHRHKADRLHDLKDKYRPRAFGENAVATALQYLPLLQASLDVNVVNTTSRTILTHVFSNDNDDTIPEATYLFPLYNGSTVVSFTCWIGGVIIVSSVEAKTKAHEGYQAAVSRNDVAALLEEHTSEIFETSLGNIPAQTHVRIEITYVNELKPDIGGEGMLVTIPTSIAPRYGTPEDYEKKAKSSLTVHDGMEICIEVSTPVPIRRLECRTHPISVELGSVAHPIRTNAFGDLVARAATVGENRRARATLSSTTPVLGKDFVLLILVHGPGLLAPRAVMESCPRHPKSSAIQVAFKPQDLFFSQLPQGSFKAEVIFIADRSGSMCSKMSSLRRSLGIFLRSLPKDGLHFNIASFGSNCSLLWPQSQPYNQETLTAAHRHLETFDANMGGTEILAALQRVVKSRLANAYLPTEILILTDGQVWDVDATVDFVRSTRESLGERIRFFALGIGDAVSHKLVEGIGCYGGGFADVLAVSSPGSWDARVVRMLKGALSPSSWTCQIAPKAEQESPLAADSTTRSFIKAPYKIPPLLDSTQAISYCLIDDLCAKYDSVTIHGISSSGQNATFDIPIEHVEVSEPTVLHLAAKAILTDMDTGKSQLHDEAAQNLKLSSSATNAYICRNGEQLGKRWSIAGKWTSFVGTSSSSPEKHFTRIYRTDRAELAKLTEFRGGCHWGGDGIPVVHNHGDRDGTEMEEDGDSGGNMASSDDSDTDTRGHGHDGDDRADPKRDSDGAGGGNGGESRGDGGKRDGASGDGNGSDERQRYQRDGNHSSEDYNRRSGGSGGDTDGSRQADSQPTENFEIGSGGQVGVEDGSKGPFWSKWLSIGGDTVTIETDDKVGPTISDEGEIDQQRSQWFQSGSGISREVFMVEVARHFGPGTTIRTGSVEGAEGYWVTASHGPNTKLVQSLKLRTEKWKEEIKNKGTIVPYLLSSTYKTKHTESLWNVAALPRNLPHGNLPRNPQPPAPSTQRPEFRSIVNCYEYSGSFSNSPEATMIFNQLLDSFNLGTESAMRSTLQADTDHQTSDKIYKTTISTIYIKKSYPSFDRVWELVIRKAEAWVDSFAHVPTVRQELECICSANWIGTEIHDDESLEIEKDQFCEAPRPCPMAPSQPYYPDPSGSNRDCSSPKSHYPYSSGSNHSYSSPQSQYSYPSKSHRGHRSSPAIGAQLASHEWHAQSGSYPLPGSYTQHRSYRERRSYRQRGYYAPLESDLLPESYPLPESDPLPESYPQPGSYAQPESYPQPGSYERPGPHPQPGSYAQPESYPQPGSYERVERYPQPRSYLSYREPNEEEDSTRVNSQYTTDPSGIGAFVPRDTDNGAF